MSGNNQSNQQPGSKSSGVSGAIDDLWPKLKEVLPRYLLAARWFGAKSCTIQDLALTRSFKLREGMFLVIFQVELEVGDAQTYLLPLLFVPENEREEVKRQSPSAILIDSVEGQILIEGSGHARFGEVLLSLCKGETIGDDWKLFGHLFEENSLACLGSSPPVVRLMQGEQSNTSIVFGDKIILKLFRRLEPGINPDVEVSCHLTLKAGYTNTPRAIGMIELKPAGGEAITIASLKEFVPNEGHAWSVFARLLKGFRAQFEGVPFLDALDQRRPEGALPWREALERGKVYFEPSLSFASRLGELVGQMHQALSQDFGDEAFEPEPCTEEWQHELYHRISTHKDHCISVVHELLPKLPAEVRVQIQGLLSNEGRLDRCFGLLLEFALGGQRIRTHGDLHLEQVLSYEGNFSIIDFKGEPIRSLAERRQKHSPLRDVAGMLRSFDYARSVALFTAPASTDMERWLKCWHEYACAAFLRGYFSAAKQPGFLPNNEATALLLQVFLLEKALYELLYEVNNRPGWIRVPLGGILSLIGSSHA